VESGWKGMPEEQGFLRDVQASACREFTTVLAPGSNVYHYNHIHVDLMRRAHRPIICEPSAMSGEEVAARAAGRNPYASREPVVTGSLGGARAMPHPHKTVDKGNDEDDDDE
jgi:Extensin-like protein C-terminus